MFDYMVLLISFVIAEVVVVSADHVGDVADCVVDDDDCVIANGVVQSLNILVLFVFTL